MQKILFKFQVNLLSISLNSFEASEKVASSLKVWNL